MDYASLTKPVRVSGFIKAIRWGLLVYGIFYGSHQWDVYHARQEKIRQERAKIWPEIKARQEAEKLARNTEQIRQLAADFGVELPPDWTAEGF